MSDAFERGGARPMFMQMPTSAAAAVPGLDDLTHRLAGEMASAVNDGLGFNVYRCDFCDVSRAGSPVGICDGFILVPPLALHIVAFHRTDTQPQECAAVLHLASQRAGTLDPDLLLAPVRR